MWRWAHGPLRVTEAGVAPSVTSHVEEQVVQTEPIPSCFPTNCPPRASFLSRGTEFYVDVTEVPPQGSSGAPTTPVHPPE